MVVAYGTCFCWGIYTVGYNGSKLHLNAKGAALLAVDFINFLRGGKLSANTYSRDSHYENFQMDRKDGTSIREYSENDYKRTDSLNPTNNSSDNFSDNSSDKIGPREKPVSSDSASILFDFDVSKLKGLRI